MIEESNGKLFIKQPSTFGIHISLHENRYYKLTVPKDAGVIDVNLDSTSGEIAIDRVDVSGKIEVTSGSILIDGFKTNELRLEATSGSIQAGNIITEKANIRFTSGETILTNFANTTLQIWRVVQQFQIRLRYP